MDLLRHLQYFLAVVDEGSFSRAADALGMAQPPLSQRIRALESRLDCALFDRSRRQIALTSAGSLLVPEARTLVSLAAELPSIITASTEARPTVLVDLPDCWSVSMMTELAAVLSRRLGQRTLPRSRSAADRTLSSDTRHPVFRPGPGTHEVAVPIGLAVSAEHVPIARDVTPHPSDVAGAAVLVFAEDDWQADELITVLAGYGLPERTVRRGCEVPTAIAQVSLEAGTCLTTRSHAAVHGLTWIALPGAHRTWHVTGISADQIATAASQITAGP